MFRTLIICFSLSLASSYAVQAETSHDHHGDHHHEGTEDAPGISAPLTKTEPIATALKAGGEPVVADLLGVVCDFCATALNKTFGKREEVAAAYVDLDTKTLSLVMKPDMTLSDSEIERLVEKAGYRLAALRRGEDALKGAANASDAS